MALCGGDHKKLLGRINRIEGQIRGLRKMVEDDRDCFDVLKQIAAVGGAARSLGMVILEDHLKGCVCEAIRGRGANEELIEQVILPVLGGPQQAGALTDSAVLDASGKRLALTTDSYVVHPLEFRKREGQADGRHLLGFLHTGIRRKTVRNRFGLRPRQHELQHRVRSRLRRRREPQSTLYHQRYLPGRQL